MERRWRVVVLSVIVAVAGVAAITLSQAAEEAEPQHPAQPEAVAVSDAIAEQIIIRYKAGADLSALRQRFGQVQATERSNIDALRIKVLKVPKAVRQQVIEALKADPRIEFAEPDSLVTGAGVYPDDTEYFRQSSTIIANVDLLWDKHKGGSLTVGVLDTGVNASHEDLSGKILPGYDFINRDNDTTDDHGHGTAVAGVIAATPENKRGVAGICWGCRILPVKVLDSTNKGSASQLAEGIRYAADNGVKIMNLSLTGTGEASAVEAAVAYAASKGATVVTVAGNKANSDPVWPAIYPSTITVGGTTTTDTLHPQSSFGPNVDIAAPYTGYTTFNDGSYTYFNGTSHSGPMVTGILAVLQSAFPTATAQQLRTAITATAETCCEGKISGGRINAIKAYNYLAGIPNTETAKPTISFQSPAANSVISGDSWPIRISISNISTVSKIHYKFDNRDPGVSSFAPFNYNWYTTQFQDGAHTVTATAFDAAGNATATATVPVTINNANPPDTVKPVVTITAPAEGAQVSGTSVPVAVTATDSSLVGRVELYSGTTLLGTDRTVPFSFNLDATKLGVGSRQITVKAVDAPGNVGEATRTINVVNAPTPPTPPGPTPPTPSPGNKSGDVSGDGRVNLTDLSMLLSKWNTGDSKVDINKNGRVDLIDLSILLSQWNT